MPNSAKTCHKYYRKGDQETQGMLPVAFFPAILLAIQIKDCKINACHPQRVATWVTVFESAL